MEIKSLNSERNLQQIQQKIDTTIQNKQTEKQQSKVQETGQSNNKRDSLQISEEGKKLQVMKNQINTRFYDQPEIIKATASKINNALPKESMTQ